MRGGAGFAFQLGFCFWWPCSESCSGCQSLGDLGHFTTHHHCGLTEAVGLQLRRRPSNSSFRYFFHLVDVAGPLRCDS